MKGLSIGYGTTGNLTVEGIHFTGGVSLADPVAGGLTFQYDNLENFSGFAFYAYPGQDGNSKAVENGVTMQYDQIDHVGQCLEADPAGSFTNWSFSHNVCGPDIGAGMCSGGQGGHYIQTDAQTNMAVENNAFVGPPDPCPEKVGAHLNVFHMNGSSTGTNFSNNLLWHTESLGEEVMFQSGAQNQITIDNNLAVEDRADLNDPVQHLRGPRSGVQQQHDDRRLRLPRSRHRPELHRLRLRLRLLQRPSHRGQHQRHRLSVLRGLGVLDGAVHRRPQRLRRLQLDGGVRIGQQQHQQMDSVVGEYDVDAQHRGLRVTPRQLLQAERNCVHSRLPGRDWPLAS